MTSTQVLGSATSSAAIETIILRWVDTFNARDLDGMLACLAPGVGFHPLRLGGLSSSYRGHDGVRTWFAELRRRRHEHQIVLAEVRCVGEDQVHAVGSLSLADELDIGPFCGLHRLAGGRIVAAYHYLTDPDMIERLGLIP